MSALVICLGTIRNILCELLNVIRLSFSGSGFHVVWCRKIEFLFEEMKSEVSIQTCSSVNAFTLDPPILWWFKRKYLVNTTKKLGYAKRLSNSLNGGGTKGLNWFSVMLQRVNFQINMLNKADSTVFCTWSQLCLRKDWMLPPFRVTPYCAIQKFFTSLHQKSAMPSRHN